MNTKDPSELRAWLTATMAAALWNLEFPPPCPVRIRRKPSHNKRTKTRGLAFVRDGVAVVRIRGAHEPRAIEELKPIPPEVSINC
jgi:hypothetical protein